MNAFTAKEYTCYYARVLDRDLEMAVDHLADMLQHSTITATDLAGEADVILSEIDMHEDSPEDMVHDVFTEALWPGHPLGRPILGTKDRIKAATRASVRGFYRRHYVPGRMVVSVAGNVRHDRVLAMLADRMDVGRPLGVARPLGQGGSGHAPGAEAVGATRDQAQAHRAGAHRARHERPRSHRRRSVRVPHREHGARRRHELAAVPGDP